MGYLLFLPFLIHAKTGNEKTVGLGLALLFIGGALGKAVCGWLGQRLGVVASVIITEAATAFIMVTTLFLPLGATLACLPLLGVVLNGTSSVLYGTVPDLAPKGDTGRAFALFYTRRYRDRRRRPDHLRRPRGSHKPHNRYLRVGSYCGYHNSVRTRIAAGRRTRDEVLTKM